MFAGAPIRKPSSEKRWGARLLCSVADDNCLRTKRQKKKPHTAELPFLP